MNLVAAERATEKLNLLLILADDLGFYDVGCYGSDLIETLYIDQFAAQRPNPAAKATP